MKAAVSTTKCKGCARCAAICPTGAIRIVNNVAVVDPGSCEGCGACIDACRANAVYLR